MPILVGTVEPPPAQPYAVAAQLLDDLPTTVKTARTTRGLTLATAAKAIGITTSTLTGLEGGSNCTRATATAVLRWLAT